MVGLGIGHPRASRGRTLAASAALAAIVLAAAACGEGDLVGESAREDDDVVTGEVSFAATGRFLAEASQRSSAEPHRLELSMTMVGVAAGPDLDVEFPLATGEVDGAASAFHMDLRPMTEELAAADGAAAGIPDDVDMTMDIVSDGGPVMYMRTPLFATIAAEAPPEVDLGPITDLMEIDDRWGRLDTSAIDGASMAEVQQAVGTPGGADPRVLLDLVAGADDVQELGQDEVDGDGVNGLAAEVTITELLEAQGQDPESYFDQMTGSFGGRTSDDVTAAAQEIYETPIPLEVWVDGAGYVRRIAYEMDLAAIARAQGGGPQQLEELTAGYIVELTDYGDESIEVELPAEEETIDITGAYRALIVLGESGQAPLGS
jgi:hypothetical protein